MPHALAPSSIDCPLTPLALVRDFGARTAMTREAVQVLCRTLASELPRELAQWRIHFGKWGGRALEKSPKPLAKLAKQYGVSSVAEDADHLLFAMQTYYAMLVSRVADRLSGQSGSDLLPGNLFSWYSTSPSKAIERLLSQLDDILAGYCRPSPPTDDGECDWFKSLYQDLFPRALRHALGEYYTPDWLARHVLDQVGYTGQSDCRLLDPACGSGTFLVMALRRLRARAEGGGRRAEEVVSGQWPVAGESRISNPQSLIPNPSFSALRPPSSALALPVGFDLNPLAVLTARANYRINIADLLSELGHIEIPVYLRDSILDEPESQCTAGLFDYVVGNPPWIAWDNLPDEYRQATKPLWERFGLFSLSGNEARHGGGKKDLSMLMLYAAADRYLKLGGRLGMVITQTVFQSKGAGDGFRRFRLGIDGPPFKVLRVDDLVSLRPFDAANWTSTVVLEKGAATEYPVAYVKWDVGQRAEGGGRRAEEVVSGQWPVAGESKISNPQSLIPNPSSIPNPSCSVLHFAYPVDPARLNSPWRIQKENEDCSTFHPLPSALRLPPSDYSAHLGANSGGANGVYWVDVLEVNHGSVRVRNFAARGKHRIETVEHVIEADLIYPLLRWSDVQRWSAVPRGHIVLSQDPATRVGIAENRMQTQYPRTLEYLGRFRELLTARAAYRRYQGRHPFYSMYNVGPYTVAPIKVVWRRMDRRINAAVIEPIDDPWLGVRPIVPQETCVLVACESSDEAHYICAVLNSAVVGELVSACSVRGGKGFGTPGILDYIPLQCYQFEDPRHVELSVLSRKAHAGNVEYAQHEIDRLAESLLTLA